MTWDYISQTLVELHAPLGLVESINYLFQIGDLEGVQACLNAHCREAESGCAVFRSRDLKFAPFAMPAPWAIASAKRICVKLGGTIEMMVLARLLESECEDHYAELARTYRASLSRPDEFLDDSPDYKPDTEDDDDDETA